MTEPQYDPRLKEAMARIEQICKEFDIGGYFALVSKVGAEFRYALPSWTSLQDEIQADGTIAVRLLHTANQPGSLEKAADTAHFLHSIKDCSALSYGYMETFTKETDKAWQTQHVPFANLRPHKEEN